MNNYELTIVLDGKTTSAKKKSVEGRMEKMIETFKGKIAKAEDWGTRDLAYKIKKSETGTYLFFEVQLEASQAKILGEKLRLEEDLIRHLLVKA